MSPLAKNRLSTVRTELNAAVKWVVDLDLDKVMARENHLKPALFFIHRTPQPLSSIPTPKYHFPFPLQRFFQLYPSVFAIFNPTPKTPPHVRPTRLALDLRRLEESYLSSHLVRVDLAQRLAKLLLISRAGRAPIRLIQPLAWDLGLPEDFASTIVPDFPDLFALYEPDDDALGLGIEIVPSAITRQLASESELQRRALAERGDKTSVIFPSKMPPSYALPKLILTWKSNWEKLPYVSPYENGTLLPEGSDMKEKWLTGVVHEILWLSVAKKVDRRYLTRFIQGIGIERKLVKRAVGNHPGVFYMSNKLRTHTWILREAYRGKLLLWNHPIMHIRYRYIALLNRSPRRCRALFNRLVC